MPLNAIDLLQDLGGLHNVLEIEPCVTRLRIEVATTNQVDATALRRSCHGVIATGNAFQLVIGPTAEALAADLQELFGGSVTLDSIGTTATSVTTVVD